MKADFASLGSILRMIKEPKYLLESVPWDYTDENDNMKTDWEERVCWRHMQWLNEEGVVEKDRMALLATRSKDLTRLAILCLAYGTKVEFKDEPHQFYFTFDKYRIQHANGDYYDEEIYIYQIDEEGAFVKDMGENITFEKAYSMLNTYLKDKVLEAHFEKVGILRKDRRWFEDTNLF